MWVTIFWLIFSLLLFVLFSGIEVAFVSASKLQLELRKNKGSKRHEIWGRFFEAPAQFLATMLLGSYIALAVFALLMLDLLTTDFLVPWDLRLILLYTLLIGLIIVFVGEFLPKALFRLYPDQLLLAFTYPVQLLRLLLFLPTKVILYIGTLMTKSFSTETTEAIEKIFTRSDLQNLIKYATPEETGDIDKALFEKALHLRDIRIKDCMVPRSEIEYVDINESIQALEAIIIRTKLSRILVIQNNDVDDMLGYVHHQQLLQKPKQIADLVLPIDMVPATMKAQELMNQFILNRTNIACVVDEFGTVAGMVALEDILEELFGEIDDEYDKEDELLEVQVSETEYLFSGRLEIAYLNEKYEKLNFPTGDYHTLSGYIVMTQETIPEQGAEFFLHRYHFLLEKVSNTRIEVVRVLLPQESPN